MTAVLSGLAVLAWFFGSLLLGLGVGKVIEVRNSQRPAPEDES
jgi:hypothetical protein